MEKYKTEIIGIVFAVFVVIIFSLLFDDDSQLEVLPSVANDVEKEFIFVTASEKQKMVDDLKDAAMTSNLYNDNAKVLKLVEMIGRDVIANNPDDPNIRERFLLLRKMHKVSIDGLTLGEVSKWREDFEKLYPPQYDDTE